SYWPSAVAPGGYSGGWSCHVAPSTLPSLTWSASNCATCCVSASSCSASTSTITSDDSSSRTRWAITEYPSACTTVQLSPRARKKTPVPSPTATGAQPTSCAVAGLAKIIIMANQSSPLSTR